MPPTGKRAQENVRRQGRDCNRELLTSGQTQVRSPARARDNNRAGTFGNYVRCGMAAISKTARMDSGAGCFGNSQSRNARHISETARVGTIAGCFGNKGRAEGPLFSKTARNARRRTRRQAALLRSSCADVGTSVHSCKTI